MLTRYLFVIFALIIDKEASGVEAIQNLIIPVILFTAAFLYIAYKKGETLKWQWGKSNKEESKRK